MFRILGNVKDSLRFRGEGGGVHVSYMTDSGLHMDEVAVCHVGMNMHLRML